MKKRGVVGAVSGASIMLVGEEGEWYNASDSAKPYITEGLRGRWVELTIIPNSKTFTYARQTTDNEDLAGIERPRLPDRDRLIVRQSALKAACEFASAHPDTIRSIEKLCNTAADLEAWVFRTA